MLSFLIYFSLSATQRGVPAWWLNNWDKSNTLIAFWSAAQDSWTVSPQYRPGIQQVRSFDDLTKSILSDDSFAVQIDEKIYGNSMLFNTTHLGGCVHEPTGELWAEYTIYDGQELPVKIRRSFYMTPYTTYYLVKYTFESVDGKSHNVKLLDYFATTQYTDGRCADNICQLEESGSASVAVSVDISVDNTFSLGSGDWNNYDNVLNRFSQTGSIPAFPAYKQQPVTFGGLYKFTVEVGKEATVSSVRGFGRNVNDAYNAVLNAVNKGSKVIIEETADEFSKWFKSGIVPNIEGDALDLYYKSLIVLKNSQNPKLGTIASSLHNLYTFKNWMRDAMMAAFMLDAAGHHDEFKAFMNWAVTAELDDKGGFHTCYDTMTGAIVGFVEPQYDGNGLMMMAINYHLQCFGDNDWVRGILGKLERISELLLNRNYAHLLGPSDRAPWEESSDHHTKEGIAEQYYPWTQGNSYGGLIALSKIEEKVGTDMWRVSDYMNRANEIKKATIDQLWDNNQQRFYRGRWADTFQIDDRAESATLSCLFTGLVTGDMAKSHLNYITSKLTHLGYGLARYQNDPYFYDSVWNPCGEGTRESTRSEPVWQVVTAYAAWCEDALGIDYSGRINWMIQYSAYGNMPTGECVDATDGALIVPSSPDCFEHGGVYVFTTLLHEKLAKSILETLQ
ncbi:hypothetical protein TRFO_30279 [Tritrichomonas foetus]|uniref:Uncharacterized protein n=1 Tax=Tritrichomonas foetus TaxID=1144522 RepID=A0A1J4JYH7_9EUKA|nr:hypothetical protein TRFO_30279 [Tritrichomonas foetus]|eukprot:OHT02550.1 hypothetical protein TRFO_30279 [Tritrichomonas foetus]